jgi:hypothetical protein
VLLVLSINLCYLLTAALCHIIIAAAMTIQFSIEHGNAFPAAALYSPPLRQNVIQPVFLLVEYGNLSLLVLGQTLSQFSGCISLNIL